MRLDRRTFLQQVGLTLLATGAGAIAPPPSWAAAATEYQKTVTATNRRKLALLVGIDNYPHHPSLEGCGMDVELQREVLIHRLGFQPADIVTITDQQGTRENIETAFQEHLIKQAQEDDTVVFHFSGYGAQVHRDPEQTILTNRLVSVDRETAEATEVVGNGILEETLLLLVQSLATRRVTVVLDTAYQSFGQLLQGSWRSRAHPDAPAEHPSQAELAVAAQLQQRLGKKTRLGHSSASRWEQYPGVLLGSEAALEGRWRGFSAGLLTYSLTQWLWEMTPAPTVLMTLKHLSETLVPIADQQPYLRGKAKTPQAVLPYAITPIAPTGGEGYVAAVDPNSNEVQLKLGGMVPWVWNQMEGRSQVRVMTEKGEVGGILQLRSALKLTAKAMPLDNEPRPQVGDRVQEWVRALPRNLGLTIALDHSLQRIERVDATSALANIKSVANVVLAGEQATDYLLSRSGSVTPVAIASTQKNLIQGYELYSAGGVPIANTIGGSDEAVKLAINRLVPTFATLLAAKWWRLLVNAGSSQLPVQVSLRLIKPQPSLLAIQSTRRARQIAPPVTDLTAQAFTTLPLGGMVQYQIENFGDQPLYTMVVGLDSRSKAIALYPPATSDASHWVVEANTSLTLPHPSNPSTLTGLMAGTSGLTQLYIICSRAPFPTMRTYLAQLPPPKGDGDRFIELDKPLPLTQALLKDLHAASQPLTHADTSGDHYALHVEAWAVLPLVYQVV
jgi:hypothetical protein